jgi:hypothetical protein
MPVIEAILEADRAAPPKQQHTAKRIFERLRDEHGYGGGVSAHPRCRWGWSGGIEEALDLTPGLLIQARDGPASRPDFAVAR